MLWEYTNIATPSQSQSRADSPNFPMEGNDLFYEEAQ